jgi:hypothetical protein
MRVIAFLLLVGSFSLFVYLKFFMDNSRDGHKLIKIENNPKELRKLKGETEEMKKEIESVFKKNNKGEN